MKEAFLKYFKNTAWVFFEQAFKAFSSLLVGIYIARYLGPDRFGVLSFAIAIVAIFMAMSRLGMDSILVRELVKKPKQNTQLMGTAFSLMMFAGICNFLVLGCIVLFLTSEYETKICVSIASISLFFQAFMVIDYNFQSQVKSNRSAISKCIALTISAIFKIYLVVIDSNLYWFAFAYALDFILISLFLILAHKLLCIKNFFLDVNVDLIKPLIKSAIPMVASSLAVILYMRIDQIMIKTILGSHQLGLYSAACRIYESWVIISVVLSSSLLTAIVKLKLLPKEVYELNLIRLFALVIWLSFIVSLFTTFYGDYIMSVSYGSDYVGASLSFKIMMWSAAFAAMGSVTARYLIVENMEKKIAFRTILALCMNIVLNLILIPLLGIEGAAISTLICVFTANYLIDFSDNQLEQLVSVKFKAICLNIFKTMDRT